MHNEDAVAALAVHIRGLSDWVLLATPEPYGHMGATLTDALLQPGLPYATVVLPRVREVQAHPEAATTSGYLRLLEALGAKALLRWKSDAKLGCVLAVTRMLRDEHVESEEDLRIWLGEEKNGVWLQRIKGVGPKTVDYLRLLVGEPTCAVDRHLYRFLAEAGLDIADYDAARTVINDAAALLGIDGRDLDYSIWTRMSTRAR
jgi:hypothetical protein